MGKDKKYSINKVILSITLIVGVLISAASFIFYKIESIVNSRDKANAINKSKAACDSKNSNISVSNCQNNEIDERDSMFVGCNGFF